MVAPLESWKEVIRLLEKQALAIKGTRRPRPAPLGGSPLLHR